MKKLLCYITLITMLFGMFNIPVSAQTQIDYNSIYMEFAKDADKNYSNILNDAISGLLLIDLNKDKVPELLAFSSAVYHFDEQGNPMYVNDKNYNNPAYKEYSHTIERAFSIIDGKIVEDSPWRNEKYSSTIKMPFLPDEDVSDTDDFCTTVRYRGRNDYLVMYDIEYKSAFSVLCYDEHGFGFSRERYDETFFDRYSFVDLPVASIRFYDEEKEQLRTRSEAMMTVLNKYKNSVNTLSNPDDDVYNTGKVSSWATAEVNEANGLNLIPPEMLHDDLTKSITRAEFAAVALQLHQAIVGEQLNWHGGYIVDIDDNIYEMYIRGAYNYGITNGTGKKDGGVIFSPDLNITREQLATMLCRVVKLNKFENWYLEKDSDFPLDIRNSKKFSDDYQISDYANEAVYYMSKHGIIKGVDSTHFAPADIATKEQAILLSLRIYNSFDQLPVTVQEEKRELKINYSVIEKGENTTADQLISGLEDGKYTIEQLSEILNIDFHKTSEVLDELGLKDCRSFEWNGYYITIISNNEDASSYEELDIYPTFVECSDTVMITTTEVKKVFFNFTDLSLKVGETYDTLFVRISASRLSPVKISWSSSDEQVATVDGQYSTGHIYAENPGTAYITAVVEDGYKSHYAECKVTVEKEQEEEQQEQEEQQEETYENTDDEFLFEGGTLLRYYGSDSNIIIPDEINGEKVLRIAANAFKGNDTIEYVEISSGIETILYMAFKDCTNLKAVFIPDSVDIIYDDAFYNCPKLINVYYNGNINTDWNSIRVFKMSKGMGTQQNVSTSSCFPKGFALHEIVYTGDVFADLTKLPSIEQPEETARPTRPTVDLTTNDEETTDATTRPTVDIGDDSESESSGNQRPPRPKI